MNNINPNTLKALITGAVIVSAVTISTVAYFITKFDWSSILRSDPNKKNLNLSNIKTNQFGNDNSDANNTLSQDSLKAKLVASNTLISNECEQLSERLVKLPLPLPLPLPLSSPLSSDDNLDHLMDDLMEILEEDNVSIASSPSKRDDSLNYNV